MQLEREIGRDKDGQDERSVNCQRLILYSQALTLYSQARNSSSMAGASGT
jgi:hypothetical protein